MTTLKFMGSPTTTPRLMRLTQLTRLTQLARLTRLTGFTRLKRLTRLATIGHTAVLAAMIGLMPATAAVAADAAGTEPAAGKQFEATVLRTGEDYGNLDTDLNVAAAGLAIGTPFFVRCKEARYAATFVNWYTDVPEGAWLGLENADGSLHLAINGGDADTTSGCTAGDKVQIEL